MGITGLKAFDNTIHKTNTWLSELMEAMGWEDRQRAYYALRVVLHCLRDRLATDEAADLGAQLPMLVRGFYYEGWRPVDRPRHDRTRDAFLAHVGESFEADQQADVEKVTRAVFGVLARHVTGGEINDVKSNLPAGLRELWP